MTTQQREDFAVRAKKIWTNYTKTPKDRRNAYVALRSSKTELITEYEEYETVLRSLTTFQAKRHKVFYEQVKKTEKRTVSIIVK